MSLTRRQSKARNLETAQHNQQTNNINFIYDKCTKGALKLIIISDTQKCVFCPIAQNFLLVGPYFQRTIFLATIASTYSTYRLRAVTSLKVLAIENMSRITVQLRIVG